MSGLKPCPFCQSENVGTVGESEFEWRVQCDDCQATTGFFKFGGDAAHAWNLASSRSGCDVCAATRKAAINAALDELQAEVGDLEIDHEETNRDAGIDFAIGFLSRLAQGGAS